MDKKYEITKKTTKLYGRTIRMIRAIDDFSDIKAGDLGGYIESEDNLSHEGNCWIYDGAMVTDQAQISGNAILRENCWVSGNSRVWGDTQVIGNVEISEDAKVSENAWVYGDTRVSGTARIFGNARVSGHSHVSGLAWVYGDAHISGDAQIFGNARVYGDAWIDINDWSYIRRGNINRGIWNQQVKINGKFYLISSTLEKLLIGIRDE